MAPDLLVSKIKKFSSPLSSQRRHSKSKTEPLDKDQIQGAVRKRLKHHEAKCMAVKPLRIEIFEVISHRPFQKAFYAFSGYVLQTLYFQLTVALLRILKE